jgi:hypothetical protein
MKPLPFIRLSTLALAIAAFGPTAAWAQDPSHADHIMVVPADLKWADAGSIPPGAKVAVSRTEAIAAATRSGLIRI